MTTTELNSNNCKEYTNEEFDAKLKEVEAQKEIDLKKAAKQMKKPSVEKIDGFWVPTEEAEKTDKILLEIKEKYGEDTKELLRIFGVKAALQGFASKSPIGKLKKSTGCYGIEA